MPRVVRERFPGRFILLADKSCVAADISVRVLDGQFFTPAQCRM
jgi:hypothetical protein